jgi:pimeloyl-ACP methyl ester carboxylesterase
MYHPQVVDHLVVLDAAHPRKLNEGLRHPSQLRRSWYFFYFQLPDLPERHARSKNWKFFREFLRDARPPYTEEEMGRYIEAWSQPGAATAMINYYRYAVRHSSEIRVVSAPTLVIWGQRDRYLGPALSEPHLDDVPILDRVERLPNECLALGPPRRGRAGQPAARRLLRPRTDEPGRDRSGVGEGAPRQSAEAVLAER